MYQEGRENHTTKSHNLVSSPNVVRMTEIWHVARRGGMKYRFENRKGHEHLVDLNPK